MPRRFTIPDALQLLFVLVVGLVALIVLVLLLTLLAVVLFHFLSPPKVIASILVCFQRIIPIFPGKRACQTKKLVLQYTIRKVRIFFNFIINGGTTHVRTFQMA